MPLSTKTNLLALYREQQNMLREGWWGFVILGGILALFGVVGLSLPGEYTLGTILLVGWLFVFGGIFEVAHAIFRRGWDGFWLDLGSGLFSLAFGLLLLARPLAAASILTVVLGVGFLAGGVLRCVLGCTRFGPNGIWLLLQGFINAMLGLLILVGWPLSSEWVIGTLVAIDLIFNGMRLISLGLAARDLPATQ